MRRLLGLVLTLLLFAPVAASAFTLTIGGTGGNIAYNPATNTVCDRQGVPVVGA